MSTPAVVPRPRVLLRALVADSGSSVNDGLTALLSEFEGLSVFGCAQEPAKVLALVEAVRPDVVLLDLRSAGPVGLKTLRQLKALPRAPQVIVLSDYGLLALREAVLAAGASHCLARTDCSGLQMVLGGLVRSKRARQRRPAGTACTPPAGSRRRLGGAGECHDA
jgi:CheY-like chemotaxis protein